MIQLLEIAAGGISGVARYRTHLPARGTITHTARVKAAAMVLFGALTARSRARRVPHAFWPLLIALALAAVTTLALVIALGVFKAHARYLVHDVGSEQISFLLGLPRVLQKVGACCEGNAGSSELSSDAAA